MIAFFPGNILGGQNGGYWSAAQAAYGNPFAQSNSLYPGALSQFAGLNTLSGLARPEPAPVERAGIRAGEITAWRCWRIEDGCLRSMYVDDFWFPGEVFEADGVEDHFGGVHAWKRQSDALNYGMGGKPVVIGTVLLWGEVVEHERGYRAQFASVASLDHLINKGWFRGHRLKNLRKRYILGRSENVLY